MTRTPVTSSNIAAIGYDPVVRDLEVEFKNGSTYTYRDVPADAHADLMAAPSVGKHLNQHIKPKFKYSINAVAAPKAQEVEPGTIAAPDAFMAFSLKTILDSMDKHQATLYRTDIELADGRFLCVVMATGDVGKLVSHQARALAAGAEKAFYPGEPA